MPEKLLTAQQAQILLLHLGICPIDAYDILADAGIDPHPNAEPVKVSLSRVALELTLWRLAQCV